MKLFVPGVMQQKIWWIKKSILFLGILLTVQHINAQEPAWSYVGIPYTDWNYDPFTIELEKPSAWPSNALENYYYVAPDHPNATDEISNGEPTDSKYGRYGYPDRPRKSIPTGGWIGDVFPAGTVIWLKGGTYNAQNLHKEWSPQFHGTETQPTWLHGDPDDKPIFSGSILALYRTTHLIVDNIQWIGKNTGNSVLTLTRDREGDTHHIALRNLRFENINYIGGGAGIVSLGANKAGATLHDVIAYKNVFKNCGGGYRWGDKDGDQHAYKVIGLTGGEEVYRIWIIEDKVLKGDAPDPLDGIFKSISGNFVQVGDQSPSLAGNHHIFVAGNYQEFGRQGLGGTKCSSDVIFSTNYCTDTYAVPGNNGSSYGHQYAIGDYNWWINNVGTKASTGWQHTANDPMKGPLFIIGNLFYNNKKTENNTSGWKHCSGITMFSQYGEHYIVNNVFDSSCHGIWFGTNRHQSSDNMHIYNNIFSNISATIDPTSRAITMETSGGINIHLENNLFDNYNDDVIIRNTNTSFMSIEELNDQPWAANNIVGDPLFVDAPNGNFNIKEGSPAIDAGTQSYTSGADEVYQLYIDRYKNDPLYPGNPADYWPKDYLGNNRVAGGVIDIGPYEFDADIFVPEPENLNPEDPNTPEPTPSETIIISPNPTKGQFSITMGTEQSVWAIIVYNELGKLITIADGNTVDLAQYPKGIYIVKILTTDKKVFSRKVLKY